MKDYRQLLKELPSNTIVCAVGEFNPPTVGHELLVKTVKRLAEQKHSAHVIFTTPSKKNILQEEKKSQYLNLMFPKTNFRSIESFGESVQELKTRYKNVIVVGGIEQINTIKKNLKESVNYISIAEKDPDANETKMKSFATKALYEEFKKKLPTSIRELDSRRLMNDVRVGMGLDPIKEQINLVKNKLREDYFKGKIFNVGDIVESNGQQYEIVKRGSNHLLLKEQSGKLISKWIQDVKTIQENIHTHQHVQVAHNDDHKEIKHGDHFSLKIGKEHHQNIFDLQHGEHHEFKCMDDREWHAIRHGDHVHFVAHPDDMRIHSNIHPKIPHNQFTGEVEYNEPERPTYQTIFANGTTMVKEAVIQPNGTDKIDTNAPEADTGAKQDMAPKGKTKGFLTFYNYTKDQNEFKVAKMEQYGWQTKSDDDKDSELDYDAIAQKEMEYDPSVVGHSLVGKEPNKGSHHLRRRKVAYSFREETIDEQMPTAGAIGTQHTGSMHHTRTPATDKFHDRAAKQKIKATLALKHEKEKENLSHKQEKERLALQNEASIVFKNKPQKPTKADDCDCSHSGNKNAVGNENIKTMGEDIDIPKDAPSIESIAKKHNVSTDYINKQLKAGMKVEAEHGKNPGSEKEIALDHLNEKPDYYVKLKKFVEHISETALNPKDPHGDYQAKRKALQDIQMDPHTHKDPQLKSQLTYSKAALEKEYDKYRHKEETVEQSDDRAKQLKRFKKQADSSLLTQDRPGMSTDNKPYNDPFFKEDEEFSEDDINKLVDTVTEEDIIDLYEEDEIILIYEDTEEEIPAHPDESQIDLMEVLTRQERMRGKIRLRKTQAKRSRSTKIALKRYSDVKTINKRARRLAIKLMKKRLLRGRPYSKISVSEKERLEKLVAKRKPVIDRIALKLVPRVRKVEKSRMSHGKIQKGAQPNVF